MNPNGNNGQPQRKRSLKAPLRNNVGVGAAGAVSNLSALSFQSVILSMSQGKILENSMRKTILDTLHTYVKQNMDPNSTIVLHDGYEMPFHEILNNLVSRDTAVVSRGLESAFILYCFGEAPHVARALLEKLPAGMLSNSTKEAVKDQLVSVFTIPEQYHICSIFANPELPILNVLFGFRPEQAAEYHDVAILPALIGHITFKLPIQGPAGEQRVVRLPELIVSKLLRQPKFYKLLHTFYQMVAMTTPPNTPEYLHRLNTGILLAALTFIGFENNPYPGFPEAVSGLFESAVQSAPFMRLVHNLVFELPRSCYLADSYKQRAMSHKLNTINELIFIVGETEGYEAMDPKYTVLLSVILNNRFPPLEITNENAGAIIPAIIAQFGALDCNNMTHEQAITLAHEFQFN